ncbi:MAG: nuclear transport factor 2 family protein [Myxococcota bacterium]
MRKTLLVIGLLQCSLACSSRTALAPPAKQSAEQQRDTSNPEGVVRAFFAAVDSHQWQRVEAMLTPTVVVDYSPLGGHQGEKSARELVSDWQAFLPGFEKTVHQPHRIATWVAGDRASATLDAIATHVLHSQTGEPHWTVYVGYDLEFVRESTDWKIARIALSLYETTGNSELAAAAIQRAKSAPSELEISSTARAAVDSYFRALEAQNLEALVSTMAPSIIQDMPLAPDGFPKQLSGIERVRELYATAIRFKQRYTRRSFATGDPNSVLVQFEGDVTTVQGKSYNNAYVNLFTTNDQGRITHIVEHFSPHILLSSWPGLQLPHYSVHAAGATVASGVVRQPTEFDSGGVKLVGHLFFPPEFDSSERYPAAVVTGSWTSVKEQMPDEYASQLAERGFIALTFDFTGFGESDGSPRQFEDSKRKIADISAAVDHLSRHVNVSPDSLIGLGVCASSGYMAHAAANDDRIKRLVLVAPWLHNPEIARSIYDVRPGGTDGLLEAARLAKAAFESSGEETFVLAASELDPLSAMYVPNNVFDYYLNPAKAAGPHYDNRFAVMLLAARCWGPSSGLKVRVLAVSRSRW